MFYSAADTVPILSLLVLAVATVFIPPRRRLRGIIERKELYGHLKALESPSWAQTTVLYEIFVRAFSPEGTFEKVTECLPRLKELGVGALWFMPIHPIGEKGRKGSLGSPYAVRDYFAVNPEYGTREDFRDLVNEAHSQGFRVILDMVANHTANDHVEMARHPEWWMRDAQGRFTREMAQWTDVSDLNYDNPELRAYMKDALRYWVEEFKVDGFRCDVAGMVPEGFWVDVRQELRRIKPDFFLLAEWEDPEMHLRTFDATYDWTLYFKMREVRQKVARAQELVATLLYKGDQYPNGALRLRFVENHDQRRARVVFGRRAFRPFAALIFTVPGIPLIYNGQEIGDTTRLELFDKITIPWNQAQPEIWHFYHRLIRLRKQNPVFSTGRVFALENDRPEIVASYGLSTSEQVALCVSNFSNQEVKAEVRIPESVQIRWGTPEPGTWSLESFGKEIPKRIWGQGPGRQSFRQGTWSVTLRPWESRILWSKR